MSRDHDPSLNTDYLHHYVKKDMPISPEVASTSIAIATAISLAVVLKSAEGRGNLESKIEKQMRLDSDVTGSKPVTEILEINFNVRASKILDVQIFLLSKRRVQFEQKTEFDAVDNGINQYGTDQPPKYVNNTHLSLRAGKFNMG
ncbi:hypothetical protein POM88_017673 [Heracleum sosnowskyi]|uniref:Uncharacterized protein n=1 Tax=Heracleum sosnowskyi TaxID=360622 RepID=A0AAD8IPL7_9APIA|nr:hypothetical protein POM88_017673 [Heracleum sosnowskyi]